MFEILKTSLHKEARVLFCIYHQKKQAWGKTARTSTDWKICYLFKRYLLIQIIQEQQGLTCTTNTTTPPSPPHAETLQFWIEDKAKQIQKAIHHRLNSSITPTRKAMISSRCYRYVNFS